MESLAALIAYRGYIWRNAVNDLRYRYAGSGMGVFWNIINPLLQVAIFGAVFGLLLPQPGDHRWLWLCLGLLPWLGFGEILTHASQSLIRGGGFLRATPVPIEVIVAESALASALSGQLAVVVLVLVTIVVKGPRLELALIPVVVFLFHACAFGLSVILACLRVFFADTGEVLRVILQLWMWTLPIVYPEALVPSALRGWLALNPPYVFIDSIRQAGFAGGGVKLSQWAAMAGWIALTSWMGFAAASRLRSQVLDVA